MSQGRPRARAPAILYTDAELLVADKPPGAMPGPGRGGNIGLPDLLCEHYDLPADELFRPISRLPEQASGVVVYARTPAAGAHLEAQLADARMETTYLVLVSGYVEGDGKVDIPLHYHKRSGKLRPALHRGATTETDYRVVERIAGNTLLECRPHRERGDQLRAHLAAIGHPLTVDPEYGGGEQVMLSDYKPSYRTSRRHPERPLVARMTLHAASISCIHPASEERVVFAAPLPKDLRATLSQLRRLS
jgi:23S rRNA-/tRNA-specific pseudouridylate synthase